MNRLVRCYTVLTKSNNNAHDFESILNKLRNVVHRTNLLENEIKLVKRDHSVLKTELAIMSDVNKYKIHYKIKQIEEELVKVKNKSNHNCSDCGCDKTVNG